jgi:two-component system cell cycle response regulator
MATEILVAMMIASVCARQSALSREGFKIDTVLDRAEVMKAVESVRADLIILDVMMPELDGYEVCRRLRRKQSTACVPILMLTAHDSLEEKCADWKWARTIT